MAKFDARIGEFRQLDVSNRVTLSKRIAFGGNSDIYKGTLVVTTEKRIEVAVKELRINSNQIGAPSQDNRLQKRFLREVEVWRRLRHPHVVPFLGYRVTKDGILSVVSPWYSHGNVVSFLYQNQHVKRLPLLLQVTKGLSYLHSLPLVHGDIKGENILVDFLGRACLCDFGMSKFLDEAMHVTGNTTSGNGGTSRFLAPEILKDQQKSIKSDVWAFGCVAIQILEGLLPYQHINNGKAVYIAIATGDVPMSSDYEPSTGSRELWNTIHSCWHAEPHSRPQITEFLNHLEESTPSGHSAESTKSEGLGEHQVESLFPGPVPTEGNLRTAPGDGNQPMHSAQSNFSSDLESDCHSESNEEPDIFRPRPMPQPHLRPPDIGTINTVLHFPRTYWAMFQNWTYDQDEDSNDDLIELLRTSAQPFSLMDELTFSGSTLSDDNAAIHGRSVENSFEESQQPSASEVVPRVSITDPRTLYRDLRRIGNEDAGPIFSARDRNGSAVTIKILSRCNLSNRDTIARHLYVLRTSMHRNIIRHIQSFYHERRLWVVMECLKGITLSALVQRSLRCFSEPQIALISREILQGVNYLHDRGLVLCNLPSCNIFVTLNGEVKLTSFGRCMLNECMLNDQTNNSTGFNQYYVASEIAEPGFDMWNLGIIAAEMLHGNSPLPEQKLRRILHLLRANKDPEGVVPDHRQLLNNYLRNVLSVDAHERPDGKTLLQDPFFDLAKPTVLEGLRVLVKAVTDCFEWSGVLHGR